MKDLFDQRLGKMHKLGQESLGIDICNTETFLAKHAFASYFRALVGDDAGMDEAAEKDATRWEILTTLYLNVFAQDDINFELTEEGRNKVLSVIDQICESKPKDFNLEQFVEAIRQQKIHELEELVFPGRTAEGQFISSLWDDR